MGQDKRREEKALSRFVLAALRLPVGHLGGGVVQDLGLAVKGQIHVVENGGAVAEGGGGGRARGHCTCVCIFWGVGWM